MAGNANNIKINPVNVLWKIEAQELYDFEGFVAADRDSDYFTLYLPTGVGYYVWFNLDAGGVDPAPAGLTEIEVAITTGQLSSSVATAVQTAIDAVTGFTATVSGTVVNVKRDDVGEVTASSVGTVTSGLLITVCFKGKNFDLGLLQGDIEPNFSPSTFTVNAHQFGLTPLASLGQGFETIEVSTAMLETTKSKLKELYKIYGGSVTPSGGTEVFGAGTAINGKNMLTEAGRLVFKPVNSTDDTENFNFMLAVPVPSSLVFSGENPQILNVTWQGFADTTKSNLINAVAIGDIFQTGI